MGNFEQGDRVAVLEDVVTTGGSLLNACERVTQAGLVIDRVCAVLDRGEGGREALQTAGYKLHALYTRPELVRIGRS
jgi:orotate phosphoribosyltransferase